MIEDPTHPNQRPPSPDRSSSAHDNDETNRPNPQSSSNLPALSPIPSPSLLVGTVAVLVASYVLTRVLKRGNDEQEERVSEEERLERRRRALRRFENGRRGEGEEGEEGEGGSTSEAGGSATAAAAAAIAKREDGAVAVANDGQAGSTLRFRGQQPTASTPRAATSTSTSTAAVPRSVATATTSPSESQPVAVSSAASSSSPPSQAPSSIESTDPQKSEEKDRAAPSNPPSPSDYPPLPSTPAQQQAQALQPPPIGRVSSSELVRQQQPSASPSMASPSLRAPSRTDTLPSSSIKRHAVAAAADARRFGGREKGEEEEAGVVAPGAAAGDGSSDGNKEDGEDEDEASSDENVASEAEGVASSPSAPVPTSVGSSMQQQQQQQQQSDGSSPSSSEPNPRDERGAPNQDNGDGIGIVSVAQSQQLDAIPGRTTAGTTALAAHAQGATNAVPSKRNSVVEIKVSARSARSEQHRGRLPLKRQAAAKTGAPPGGTDTPGSPIKKKTKDAAAAAAAAAAATATDANANTATTVGSPMTSPLARGAAPTTASAAAPPAPPEQDQTASTAEKENKAQPTRRRNEKPPPPPPQLLCEALSSATGLRVTAVSGRGPWGGEEWVSGRKRSRSSTAAVAAAPRLGGGGSGEIRLALVRFRPQDASNDGGADRDLDPSAVRKADWSNLEQALRSILSSSSSPADDPFRPHLLQPIPGGTTDGCIIRTAATWHSKTFGSAARDGIDRLLLGFKSSYNGAASSSGLDSVDREGMGRCLSVLAGHVAGVVASSLTRELSRSTTAATAAAYDTGSDDDDGGLDDSLFSDGYGADAVPQSNATSRPATSAIADELLDLCGRPDASRVVTRRFLADVLSHPSTDGSRLARSLLGRSLGRLPSPDGVQLGGSGGGGGGSSSSSSSSVTANAMTVDAVHRHLSAVSHLLGSSPDVAAALAAELRQEAIGDETANCEGRDLERSSILRCLLCLGGYSLPDAGFEVAPSSYAARRGGVLLPRFYVALKSTPAFPLGMFDPRGMDPALGQIVDEARSVMRDARTVAGAVLEQSMKKGGKDGVFGWLGCLSRSNEAQANLLQEQLLSVNDVHVRSSSRPFLSGTAVAVLNLCCHNLVNKYHAKGRNAFDVRYLLGGGSLNLSPEERRLVHSSASVSGVEAPSSFAGATEFFFLTAALLRAGLFPALRVREELQRRHEAVFKRLENAAASERQQQHSQTEQRRAFPEQESRSAGALLGWTAFLDDRELMVKVVEFSLLQLQWLVAVADDEGTAESSFALIPEWMAKLPAQWIARVAVRSQACITPQQGEVAVQCATRLLECGMTLSPPVQTELIRIAGAFVKAGVNRARHRHAARHRRKSFKHSTVEEDKIEVVDDRELDIYTSFDVRDLGVTVFTNQFVSTRLCPTLIHTFGALDAVEGMDVEREHQFDKFHVKCEVADLLLRLWLHPSGECRKSIVRLNDGVLADFICSARAAIGLLLDGTIQRIDDIRGVLKQRTDAVPLSSRDKRNVQFYSKHLASGFAESRRLLLLLCHLSEEPKIATIMGGGAAGDSPISSDLATMIVSFLDKLTNFDGGTSPCLDFRQSLVPTSKLAARLKSGMMMASEREAAVNDLLHARTFLSIEYGLDISVVAHLLLGLAARWHLAAKRSRGGGSSSAFLDAVASNDDCTVQHWRNIFSRLISSRQGASAEKVLQAQNAELIFETDGHVDSSIWKERYEVQGSGLDSCRSRQYLAQQDQMTHSRLDHVASMDEIVAFLDDFEEAKAQSVAAAGIAEPMGEAEILKVESQVLKAGHGLREEGYTEALSDFVVSSDSFLSSTSSNTFVHYYNSTARKNANPTLGKSMIKEARKCYRNLPQPHPNASIFVCYAEERMDLCRVVIIGAVETPYSMGVFEFDVFYPSVYPQCSPMVTFMTTGGGQVRFSPNLYNDGKVCISLLGTANAADESQRWNPNHSSLAQVLLSIQTQILGAAEPYYTEGGGHEGMRGTRAGIEGSARYNNTLRLATLRFAIIGQLKSPPRGFEEVTRRHFAMCRKRLLVQARLWTMEARGSPIYDRFKRAYEELLLLFSATDKQVKIRTEIEASVDNEQWEHPTEPPMFGTLHPLADDMRALQTLDTGVHQHFSDSLLDYDFDAEEFGEPNDSDEED